MPDRLATEETVHSPTSVYPHEITQQCAPCTEAISTCKRTNASSFDHYRHRIRSIGNSGPFYLTIVPIPGRSKVKELQQLEITKQGIIDRFIEQGGKNREPQFTVYDQCIISICCILLESSQIHGQGLEGIIRILWKRVLVILREHPS